MTNRANSIATRDVDFAKARANRAWLVTRRGLPNIYSSATVTISATSADQISHVKPPGLSHYDFSSSTPCLLGFSLPIIPPASSAEFEGRLRVILARQSQTLLQADWCQIHRDRREFIWGSSRLHGEFMTVMVGCEGTVARLPLLLCSLTNLLCRWGPG